MIDGKTVLAIVPARSGSKRCPGKNFKSFRGKPLYLWALDHAKESKYIDKTILSTDDKRTPDLCTDTAKSEDVMRYHLQSFPYHWAVLLQPTSPLRTTADIDACIERAQWGNGCISTYHGRTNGAVYVASAEWLAEHDFNHLGLLKYEMPEERSLDIDYDEDFNVVFPGDSAP